MEPRWEHYEHGADVGLRGFGGSRSEAFEQVALALTAAIADPQAVRPLQSVALRCTAGDDESLLAAWLGALGHEMASRGMLFSDFKVRLHDGALSGEARGEPLDPARHQPTADVKRTTAATPRVARHGDGWMAQAVVDV
jgi:tRNA nucleotidyltransferase (CCA-adding enzyme)